MNNNYLYHHGILGQRWGVRRYQNPDGSYTSLGAKRHAKEVKSLEKKLNKSYKNSEKKHKRYTQYNENFKLADEGAKEALTASQYGRWATSGARMSQKQQNEKLKKASDKAIKRTNDMLNKIDNDYSISFDITSQTYKITPNIEKSKNANTNNRKETKPTAKERYKQQQEAANKSLKEAPSKSTAGFAKYVKEQTGGFDMIDDAELLELLQMEYEESGRKAYK